MPKLTATNLTTGPYAISDRSGLTSPAGILDLGPAGSGTATRSTTVTTELLERLAPDLDAAQTGGQITWKWEDDPASSADDSREATRVATVSPVVATVKDRLVVTKLAVPGAVAVTLPSSPVKGQVCEVQDGTGDAGANNITVSPAAGTVNGGANLVINTNYGRGYFTYTGTEWLGVTSVTASSGAAGNDLSGTFPNPTVSRVDGVTQAADYVVRKASVTIGNAALKTLNATPVDVIAAPGAGKFIELVSVHAKMVFAGAAFDNVGAIKYLELRNTNGTGELLTQNVDPTGFADQGTDQQRFIPLAQGAAALVTPKDNAKVVAHIAAGEWFAAAGGGSLKLEVLYRVRNTAI